MIELSAVEEYLLLCGQIAYSGSEMYAGLDMRQTLVNDAIATGREGEPKYCINNNSIYIDLFYFHPHAYDKRFVKSGYGETESPCNELDDIARHGNPSKPSGYYERW